MHSTPVNLPHQNENRERFLNRSCKILMQTGKSQEESQSIAESIWTRHIQSLNFQPRSDGDVRWINNRSSFSTQQNNIDQSNSNFPHPAMMGFENSQRTNFQAPSIPSQLGNSELLQGFQPLIKGQQEQTQILSNMNSILNNISNEIMTIRSKGHGIKNTDDKKPNPSDFWNPKKTSSANRIFGNLGIGEGPILDLLNFIVNPIKQTTGFVERKTKGILQKGQEILQGQNITNFKNDPSKLLEAAGIFKLDDNQLQNKVMTQILPTKLEEITGLQNEQLDILRNIYSVNKQLTEHQTGNKIEYQRTVNNQSKVFNTRIGEYMTEDELNEDISKQQTKIEDVWNRASNSNLNTIIGQWAGRFGFDINPEEYLNNQSNKLFGTDIGGVSDDEYRSNTLTSTYNEISAQRDMHHYIENMKAYNEQIEENMENLGMIELDGSPLNPLTYLKNLDKYKDAFTPSKMKEFYDQSFLDENGNLLEHANLMSSANSHSMQSIQRIEESDFDMSQFLGNIVSNSKSVEDFISSEEAPIEVKISDIDSAVFKVIKDNDGLFVKFKNKKAPMMHGGGTVKTISSNSGIVDSDNNSSENVTRTLQKGEYVFTKNESNDLISLLKELVRISKKQSSITTKMGLDIFKIRQLDENDNRSTIETENISSSDTNTKQQVFEEAENNRTVKQEMREIEIDRDRKATESDRKEADSDRNETNRLLGKLSLNSKNQKENDTRKGGLSGLMGLLSSGMGSIISFLGPMGTAVAAITTAVLGIPTTLSLIGDLLSGIWDGIKWLSSDLGQPLGQIAMAISKSRILKGEDGLTDAQRRNGSRPPDGPDGTTRPGFLSRAWDSTKKAASFVGEKAMDAGRATAKFASDVGGKVADTVIDAGKQVYEGGKAAVKWVGDKTTQVWEYIKSLFNKIMDKFKPYLNKLKELYSAIKSKASNNSFVKKSLESISELLNSKFMKFIGKWLGRFLIFLGIYDIYKEYNNMMNTKEPGINRVISALLILCNILLLPPISTLIAATGVGIAFLVIIGGISVLLPYLKTKPDGQLPDDVTKEMEDAERKAESSSGDEQTVKNSLSVEKAPTIPENTKSISNPPMMHGGGIVKTQTYDNKISQFGNNPSINPDSGLVDSSNNSSENVTRTLQKGEYVFTKNETKDLTTSLNKLVKISEDQYSITNNMANNISKIKSIDEEQEKDRQEEKKKKIVSAAISSMTPSSFRPTIDYGGGTIPQIKTIEELSGGGGSNSIPNISNNMSNTNNQFGQDSQNNSPMDTSGGETPSKEEQNPVQSGSSGKAYPVTGGRLVSGFYRNSGKFHGGVDLVAAGGSGKTPVVAYKSGTVIRSDYSKSYGNVVYIKHDDDKTQSRYAHLHNAPSVKKGQKVQAGTKLGMQGNTGRSQGPHLHFEIRKGRGWDQPSNQSKHIDPWPYIKGLSRSGSSTSDSAPSSNSVTGDSSNSSSDSNSMGTSAPAPIGSSASGQSVENQGTKSMSSGGSGPPMNIGKKSIAENNQPPADLSSNLKQSTDNMFASTAPTDTSDVQGNPLDVNTSRLNGIDSEVQKISNTQNTQTEVNKTQMTPQMPIIVQGGQQDPKIMNTQGNPASMAQKQTRTVDHVTSTLIDRVFANTITSFMNGAMDFGLGNKATTIFKNSASA